MLIPVFTPVHASWLNQIEVCFSVVQRKILTPGDFGDLAALESALLGFQHRYAAAARPFERTFTRNDLTALLEPDSPLQCSGRPRDGEYVIVIAKRCTEETRDRSSFTLCVYRFQAFGQGIYYFACNLHRKPTWNVRPF